MILLPHSTQFPHFLLHSTPVGSSLGHELKLQCYKTSYGLPGVKPWLTPLPTTLLLQGSTRPPLQVPSCKWKTSCSAFSKAASSGLAAPQFHLRVVVHDLSKAGRAAAAWCSLSCSTTPWSKLVLCRLWHWSQKAKSLGTHCFLTCREC